jgi:hypothetical protein
MGEKKIIQIDPNYLKINENSGGDEKPKRVRKTMKNRRISKSVKTDAENEVIDKVGSSKLELLKAKIRQQIEEKTRKIREEIMKKKTKLEKALTDPNIEKNVPQVTLKSFNDIFNTDINDDDIQLYDEEDKKREPPKLTMDKIVNSTPKTSVKEEPVYGILKGGTKPTYSEFKKTLKSNEHHSHNKTVKHIEPPKDWLEKDWNELTKKNTMINGQKPKLKIGEEITDDEFFGGKKKEPEREEERIPNIPEKENKSDIPENKSDIPENKSEREEERTPDIPENKPDNSLEIDLTTEEEEPHKIMVSPTEDIETRQEKLREFKDKFGNPSSLPSLRRQKIKTLKRSFILGKYKVRKDNQDVAGRSIGVLIKNNKTRKHIKEHLSLLEKTSITKIKTYLKKRNIIRAGSNAPDFLLRKIFMDLLSSGEIYNHNGELLLHNFIVDEEDPEKLTLKDENDLQLDVVLL